MPGYEISLGRAKETHDHLWPRQIDLMRATLCNATRPGLAAFGREPQHLPRGWHWLFFHEPVPGAELGRDGHEKLGRFIPDLPLKRRMWAGGELVFHAEPQIDTGLVKMTTIRAIDSKRGQTGEMWFVTLEHEIRHRGTLLVSEVQNLVYREEAMPGETRPELPRAPADTVRRLDVLPDPVLLFRYSALTFNGHRIHYDADYARTVEGYRGIVFHGPLTATLMMNFASELEPERQLRSFSFRGTSPVEGFDPFRICAGGMKDGKLELWAATADGALAMRALAAFA